MVFWLLGLIDQFLASYVEVDYLVSLSCAFTVNSLISCGGLSEQVENPKESVIM